MSEQVGVPSLGSGDRIAGYRIDGVVGRGGMGLVYRAWDERLQRAVAIKVIAPEFAVDSKFRARFEQESLLAAQIEHPNVIPVHQVGETEGLLFIVMRYVDGVDLGELLGRAGRLEPRRAVSIVNQVAVALDAAHARGLVHRDVKPGNILVSGAADAEHVYLTDFGITKRIGDTQGLTATGQFVGTVHYVAPEQILSGAVDARSDVYALGCVLYQLLAGVVPFAREADLATLIAHVNESPAPLRQIAPAVPAELEGVVTKAMAKDPDDRYQSAGDLGRAAIAGAQSRGYAEPPRSVATGAAATQAPDAELAEPDATTPSTLEELGTRTATAGAGPGLAAESSRRSRRRHRRPWALGVAAAALVAALTVLLIPGSGSNHAPGAALEGDLSANASTPWRSLPPLPDVVKGGGVASYDGKLWVVGGARAGHGQLTDVYAYDPQRGRWLTGADGVPQLPVARAHTALVSTGQQLFAIGGFRPPGGAVGTVFRLDTPSGRWILDSRALPRPRGAGAAAYDGKRIVFAGGYGDGGPQPEIWTLTGGGWTSIGTLQQPREHLAAATDGRGTVWFIGGKDTAGNASPLVDVIHQNSVNPGPTVEAVTGAAAVGVGSGFCAIAGETRIADASRLTGNVQCRQTSARFPALDPRNYLGAAVLANKLYVVGGYGLKELMGTRSAEVHDIRGAA